MRRALADGLELHALTVSPLHDRDARAKLLATLAVLVCLASFPRYAVTAILPLALVPALFVIVGAVPVGLVARIVAVALPFVVAVGAANPWLDRVPVTLPGGGTIAAGWLSLLSLALRAVVGVSLVAALVATSGIPALTRAMSGLGVPDPFVVQVQLLHRYLGVLAEEVTTLLHARSLREPQRRLPRIATARALLVSLLHRSWERAGRIHRAMCVRGFRGTMPVLAPSRFRCADAALVALVAGWCVLCRFGEPVPWLGRQVMEALR